MGMLERLQEEIGYLEQKIKDNQLNVRQLEDLDPQQSSAYYSWLRELQYDLDIKLKKQKDISQALHPCAGPSHHSKISSTVSSLSKTASTPPQKRHLDWTAAYSEPKRLNTTKPSPPSTPDSMGSEVVMYEPSSRYAVPYGTSDASSEWTFPDMSGGPEVIDLTASDPPSPVSSSEHDCCNQAYSLGLPESSGMANQRPVAENRLALTLQSQPASFPAFYASNAPQFALDVQPPLAQLTWISSDRSEFGDLVAPSSDSEAMNMLLGNISAHVDSPEQREQTPSRMSSELKGYQKIGLTWLIKMETSRTRGGILADGMGLGKTIQALALICARPSEDPLQKTTLIVAPLALMRQWEKEIERHVKPLQQLKVFVYHQGAKKRVDFNSLRQYDVVLTTFGTLASEFKSNKKGIRSPLVGSQSQWYRVILDEAQCIKNRRTGASEAAHALTAKYRLAMTGTPMMNNIEELYSLLKFLRVYKYENWEYFSRVISAPLRKDSDLNRSSAMRKAQILLKSIMLRRTKDSVVDGQAVCTIPPKHIATEAVQFDEEEKKLYVALETQSRLKFNRYLRAGTVLANYAHMLVLLLRLRQACCHPHLIQDLSQPATVGISAAELMSRVNELAPDVVERLKETEHFDCPICYEVDTNPTIIIPCGHTACGECVEKLADPLRAIRDGNDSGGSKARCPHCRGELNTSRITDYRHFCMVHCPDKLSTNDFGVLEEALEDDSGSDDDEESDFSDEDVDAKGNLAGFIVSDEEERDDYEEDEEVEAPEANGDSEAGPSRNKKRKYKAKGKERRKEKPPKKTLAQLKNESLKNRTAKAKYLRRLRKTWVPSSKIQKTMELLSKIIENDPTEKILVFSQWTSLLDLLEVPMSEKNMRYQRYDGSMSIANRVKAVEAFMDNAEEKAMLLSLKAGNAGLNLAKASRVIILDPFWNPFVEEQAVDRAHRMPQTREVHVHRILVPETVEDRICQLQDKKRNLVETALDEDTGQSLTRLGVNELRYLFGAD